MYVSSGPFYRPYVRRITNIRLPSRSGPLGRLAFDVVIRAFRVGYFVYYKIKGRRANKRVAGKIVSDKYKFILLMVPKVATSSFFSLFLRQPAMDFEAFRTRDSLAQIFSDGREAESYYKFAFVRNPWARVVSCYNDKICNVNKINKVMIIAKYSGLRPGMSFAEFVNWLCSEEGRDEIADPHWRSQCAILSDPNGTIPLDFVGKLENLEEDIASAFDQIPLPKLSMPHKNTSGISPDNKSKTEISQDYREYYTDKTKYMIAQRYKNDIEAFGYVF